VLVDKVPHRLVAGVSIAAIRRHYNLSTSQVATAPRREGVDGVDQTTRKADVLNPFTRE
jgi:hypothetical protein